MLAGKNGCCLLTSALAAQLHVPCTSLAKGAFSFTRASLEMAVVAGRERYIAQEQKRAQNEHVSSVQRVPGSRPRLGRQTP